MESKKIIVTEKITQEGIDILEEAGYEVDLAYGISHGELIDRIPEYHGLIVRSSTRVTRTVIEAAKNLEVIGRAGVSIDNIDIASATEHGVVVCNAPSSNIISAAEQTMGLILACARNTAQANASMHAGKWERDRFVGVELLGKTLAIFGLGRVGGLVAERARAFGMKVIAYDPYCSIERAEKLGVTLYNSIDEILPKADFITVHLPKTSETVGMFGPNEYAAMKDGVILINVARDMIYDTKSLSNFIAAGKIFAAGFDMHDEEPCLESPLHEFENVILTPRLGSLTKEAQARAGRQIAKYVDMALQGSIVPTAVNLAPLPPESIDTVGPFVPTCQLIGRMLAQLMGEVPQNLKITCSGTLAGADISILLAGVLAGMLSYDNVSTVAPENAETMARRHGIKVDSENKDDALEYASSIAVDADGWRIAATLTGATSSTRLISVLGYRIDITPASHSLIFEYVDAPGRMGVIGTILGNHGVNITTMQIGTNPEEKCALVYMNVEGSVTDDIIEELREAIDLKNLWSINL